MSLDVEYLTAPGLIHVRQGLYVAPAHVAAVYLDDDGTPVLLMASGQEIRNPSLEFDELVQAVS